MLNLGTQAKFWSRITRFVSLRKFEGLAKLAQLPNFIWLTKLGINLNLSQLSNFHVADKALDSQPKLTQALKFSEADKARDSLPKLSPSPKI